MNYDVKTRELVVQLDQDISNMVANDLMEKQSYLILAGLACLGRAVAHRELSENLIDREDAVNRLRLLFEGLINRIIDEEVSLISEGEDVTPEEDSVNLGNFHIRGPNLGDAAGLELENLQHEGQERGLSNGTLDDIASDALTRCLEEAVAGPMTPTEFATSAGVLSAEILALSYAILRNKGLITNFNWDDYRNMQLSITASQIDGMLDRLETQYREYFDAPDNSQ